VKVGATLKEKWLYISYSILGTFENKVFAQYNYCWGPL